MPQVRRKDQYGDNCEVCGAVYAPTELKNPYSALSGATPVLKAASTSSSSCPTRAASAFLEAWTRTAGCSPRWPTRSRMVRRDGDGQRGLGDWDISRDAPYFGIEIPDAPGKYFYVWLDAPIGYLASLKNLLASGHRLTTPTWPTRRWSSTTSSARTSSPSTRCSGRRC
jgi:methionyl-tRNA synthetase